MASALPTERKVQSFFKGKAVQEITQGVLTFQKLHIFGGLLIFEGRWTWWRLEWMEHALFMFQVGTLPPLQIPLLNPGANEAP